MAVVDVLSNTITNRDASPKVLASSNVDNGRMQSSCQTVEITTANSSDSTYRFFSIPSNARVSEILAYSDDMGTATAADVGLYDTTENGGAIVDADFFASALDLNGGALVGSHIEHESGVFGVEDREKPLWEALGLSSDPNKMYDLVATLTAAADTGGTLTLEAKYII